MIFTAFHSVPYEEGCCFVHNEPAFRISEWKGHLFLNKTDTPS